MWPSACTTHCCSGSGRATRPQNTGGRENGGKPSMEGPFASLDRLGWARSRLRGLWKVDCEGYMAGLAHNVLKAVRQLRDDAGTTGPLEPRAVDPVPPAGPKASTKESRMPANPAHDLLLSIDFFNRPLSPPLTTNFVSLARRAIGCHQGQCSQRKIRVVWMFSNAYGRRWGFG